MLLIARGATLNTDGTLPSTNSLKIGLTHLKDCISKNRNIYTPKITQDKKSKLDYSNYIMLCYYRNALNYIFFNESVIVCSLFSFGEQIWEKGVDTEDLFAKACFMADLIKREEVLKEKITPDNRQYYEGIIQFMVDQRLI